MSPYLSFSRRDIAVALLLIMLAFAYRCVIIWDRAAAPDNIGAFAPLPEGADQRVYYESVFQYRDGSYPPATFHFQPGMSYFLIGVTSLLGTTDLAVLRFALAALASINCGLLLAVTQLAFGVRRVSYTAGLLLALYPVGAFYDTDLVITSQATILLTVALFGAFLMYRAPKAWIGAVILGAVIGIGAITRLEIAVAAAALTAWLFWQRWSKHSLAPFVLTAAAALAFIVPVALHNRLGGADFLITPVGPAELYRGFNRDANGMYHITRADQTTRYDYLHFLWLDAQLEPVRLLELVLRKLGLFFSASEPGNNLNYVQAGEAVSPVLRFNPLDFRILIALTVIGMAALWPGHKAALAAFALACAAMTGMTMLIWIEARIRTPIIGAMIPCAAYGIYEMLSLARRRVWRPRFAWVALALAIGLSLSWLAENMLPRKTTRLALPADAQPVNAVYNNELRLVGFRIEEQYSPAGIFQPFRPYVVSLYWELLRPTAVDYSFALKFIVGETLIDQFDHPIGYVSYPERGTSVWEAGSLYVEHVGLSAYSFELPTETSGYLLLEIYPEREAQQLLTPVGAGESSLHLAHPAVVWGNGLFPTLGDAVEANLNFGGLLTLRAWELPATAQPGQIVPVVLGWQTTSTPIRDNYAIGLYLQNEQDAFVTNFDSPPRNGQLLTTSLPTDYRLEETRFITLSDQPGTYRVYVAVYEQHSLVRLPVNGTTETTVLIGEVRVE